ncbi:hypothetical protein Tco_1135595 [Tanacetum coccineum]
MKDHNDSLIAQVNSKTVENADLKAQIQEKVFADTTLKNKLRKLKGNSVDTKFAKPSILGKPVLQPPRNQSVVRQPNAFKSERPNFSKPRFASQVDVNNVLSKPVTPHYLPKVREYVLAKPHHVIAPGSSRNSQEESYGSNDMAHNHYLEEARKKTQERNRNLKSSVMHTTSLQITTNGSKQKPRSNNQTSRSLHVSKSSGVTSNSRIFKIAGLRWIPTRKMFTDNTTKVDSESLNGSNDDITNPYECDQTLNVSAGLALQRQIASADNTSGPFIDVENGSLGSCNTSVQDSGILMTPRTISSVAAQEPVASTGTPSSMIIDQDVPSIRAHEFEHLEIWELVPRPDQVMIITLKWIYEVKLDELGGGLKNKANQGAKGKRSG